MAVDPLTGVDGSRRLRRILKDGLGTTIGQVVARGGVEPPTFRFSVGRSYQLSYLAEGPGVTPAQRGPDGI